MPALCTIGYRGRSFSGLSELLQEHGVGVLIDIRYAAETRQKAFAKSTLSRRLPSEAGIAYVHCGALGNRNYRSGPISIVDLDAGAAEVERLVAEHGTAAIMCACRSVEGCHREEAARALAERNPDWRITHV